MVDISFSDCPQNQSLHLVEHSLSGWSVGRCIRPVIFLCQTMIFTKVIYFVFVKKNLKAAEDGAAVGDRPNSTCESQKADGWQDVAVDELPEFL